MCVDIFAPGLCIDVEYLLEQIWFDPPSDSDDKVGITEVYDCRIANPACNPPLKELLLLFPHDCTISHGIERADREIQAHVLSLGPAAPQQRYDWPYSGETAWVGDPRHRVFQRTYAVDPDDPRELLKPFPGKLLLGVLDFPQGLDGCHLNALAGVRKTLATVILDAPLGGGEVGWLRLEVRPQSLDHRGARRRYFPGIDEPLFYDRRLSVTCPLIVRDSLQIRLLSKQKAAKPHKVPIYQALNDFLLLEGFGKSGTSTRIEDHRIALVACGGVDIVEGSSTSAIDFYGEIPFQEEERIGLWWGGGSSRNRQNDLVHNVNRVIHRLEYIGRPENRKEIERDLAPSGKHEAFATLLGNMIDIGLVSEGHDGRVSLPRGFEGNLQERMVKLRSRYVRPLDPGEIPNTLMFEFTDLHAFMLSFRLWWFGRQASLSANRAR